MEEPREGLMIICAPVEGNEREEQIAGSVKRACTLCGRPVWVAPTGRKIHAEREGAYYVCMECGLKTMAADPDPQLMEPTEEQKDEIARHREHNA